MICIDPSPLDRLLIVIAPNREFVAAESDYDITIENIVTSYSYFGELAPQP
jgi:hypothetical protein